MITPEQLTNGSEDGEQLALLCWCALNLATYPELRWLYHCPNGGSRDKREAAKLKAMGTKPGVPDLMLPIKRAGYSGLYIELKKLKGGKVSDEQREWLDHLRKEGFGAIVCYGWLEAKQTLIEYLNWKE